MRRKGPRAELKRLLDRVIEESLERPSEFWSAQEYPITYEVPWQDRTVQVEISLLESGPHHIHLLFTVLPDSYGGIRWPWDTMSPMSRSVLVKFSS
jgi:hypothetical protein